jgi:hypothetical protein
VGLPPDQAFYAALAVTLVVYIFVKVFGVIYNDPEAR